MDYWNEWSEKEALWLLGYIKATVGYVLQLLSCGDLWEDMFVTVLSDANFRLPRSTTGGIISIEGDLGSLLPTWWVSRVQTAPATCSGDSETISWGTNAKAAMRVAAMMEYTTVRGRVPIIGYVDNESLRIGIRRGYSPRMSGHLKGVAGANFQLLQSTQVLPKHVAGVDNSSDALTKTLPRGTMLWLMRRYFGLHVPGVPKAAVKTEYASLRRIYISRRGSVAAIGGGA